MDPHRRHLRAARLGVRVLLGARLGHLLGGVLVTRPCAQCGDPLPEWARPTRKYCGERCRNAADYARDKAAGKRKDKTAYVKAIRGRECRYCLIRDDEGGPGFKLRAVCTTCARVRLRSRCPKCGGPVSPKHGLACPTCDPPPPGRALVVLLAPDDDRERRIFAYWPEGGHQRTPPPQGGIFITATPEQWRSKRLAWCLGSYAPSEERACVQCRASFVPRRAHYLRCPPCVAAGHPPSAPLPERACVTCSASFVPRQRRQYACSPQCGKAYRNKMDRGPQEWRVPRTCTMCGASYVPRVKNQRFCQRQCKERWLRGGMRRER